MSNTVRLALMYIAGAVAGGFLGGKIADVILYQEEPETEETLPEMEEYGMTATSDSSAETEIITDEKPNGIEKVSKKKKAKEVKTTTDYTQFQRVNPHVQKARLSELASKYHEDEPAEEDPNKPHIISFEEYVEPNGHPKVTLAYYEEDDTLCDGQEEIIPDQEGVLGSEALVKFGSRSDDPDMVFVHNPGNGIDYEVVRHKGKYSVLVLGMDDEGEPEVKKRKGRKKNEEGD